ncbi:MAG: acyl carrier protein [Lachnospiraceae bacterium]|nr:acyl carrier protein [Lachnospiraceae bacterium]
MPAYFSMKFVCEKKCIYPKLVQDFYTALIGNGFRFAGGYWGYDMDTPEEIIAWNQAKLEADYVPEPSEPYFNGYKQMLFEYGGFSEVRGFWLNRREDAYFEFHVILPEDELICWHKSGPEYDAKKVDRLVLLGEKMWQFPCVCLIQTELELSDPSPSLEEICDGAEPGAEPFAILPEAAWNVWNEKNASEEKYVCRRTDRGGVIIKLRGVEKAMEGNKELQDKIIALIEEILAVPAGTITEDTLIEDVEEWDSLMHVTIIGELEERLGVKIPLEDAIELTGMRELLQKAGCL